MNNQLLEEQKLACKIYISQLYTKSLIITYMYNNKNRRIEYIYTHTYILQLNNIQRDLKTYIYKDTGEKNIEMSKYLITIFYRGAW